MTDTTEGPEASTEQIDALLQYLRASRNFDLSGYKRAGLVRRVLKRMRAVGASDVPAYIAYLEQHADEHVRLLDTLLINVTAFFRDDVPWDYMRSDIIPRILESKLPHEPIRVWSAGCATGQEAYTLAIVFAEALGEEAFRERVKIYATDLDDLALLHARHGAYDEADIESVPAELRDKYFQRQERRVHFRKDLRRSVIFGRNDLLQDAPISRIDLLACRNTLMYFDAPTQAKVLTRFHFALNDTGVLFLGRAETLLTHSSLFVPIDLRRRVFAKVPRLRARDRLGLAATSGLGVERAPDAPERLLQELAFEHATVPQLVIDGGGRVLLVNARARTLFQLGPADIGRALSDLEVSYRPFELRSLIDQANADGRTVTKGEVPWRLASGEQRWFEIVVTPFTPLLPTGNGSEPLGVCVTFSEVTRYRQLQEQIQQSQAELEAAYQELQSTNEELETTNEELHSTVEELETTNEELQSTNEELETMNEELQSTNEELQTINDELRVRSEELNQVNGFLESVFTSHRAAVVVLDREQRVLVWNTKAENMWGLRADEVEHAHILNLDFGLPVAELIAPIRQCLAGEQEHFERIVRCTNRRGRTIDCEVTIVPLIGRQEERARGVIMLMDEVRVPAASPGEPTATSPATVPDAP